MIILNSILWYLYNRMDCMKTDVLISVITQFYSDKEVEEAKKVLYENFTSHRIIKRKGENKTEMNLKDMLELLHVTSSNPQPEVTFATASCNFPPLDFKNIDSGIIISNLQTLKKEVRDLQQESVSNKTLSNQLAEVRSMVSELSALAKRKPVTEQTTGRPFGPYQPSTDNLQTSTTNDNKSKKKSSMSYSKAVKQQPDYPNSSSVSTTVEASSSDVNHTKPKPTETGQITADDDWSVYRLRRRRPKNPHEGKLKGSNLQPVAKLSRPAEVFLSRLRPETSCEEVQHFAQSQFSTATSITCTQLKSKFDFYSSFHLTIQGISFSDSINPNNWSEGVLVKRFYYKSGTDNVSNPQKSERSIQSSSQI